MTAVFAFVAYATPARRELETAHTAPRTTIFACKHRNTPGRFSIGTTKKSASPPSEMAIIYFFVDISITRSLRKSYSLDFKPTEKRMRFSCSVLGFLDFYNFVPRNDLETDPVYIDS